MYSIDPFLKHLQIIITPSMAAFLHQRVVMNDLWTAQVHLLTPPAEFGDTQCCTNVVAWGSSAAEFANNICTILGRREWSVLSIMQCRRASAAGAMMEELSEQIEEARKKPGSCIFGTLHYYPSKPS
jgi:nitric oxide synthase oxygenase domain/subunit